MAEVGSAFVSLIPSARGFGSKMQSEVGGEVDSAGKKMGSRFGTAIKAGAVAVLAGGAVLARFLGDSVAEAREAQKVGALTAATIKATGGAANVTAKQVGDLAGALSAKTGIDDEVIQSGQNMLLTFKNIRNEAGAGNDIFNQSTTALIDMASAMGTEPKQAAIQLGKALNDPIKGVTALSRVGVQFTDQQRAQIKTMVESGNTMGAQKVILAELTSQFGGAAAAQATASDKAKVAFGNLQEQIGIALLPVIDRLANTFTNVLVPAVSSFITGMQTGTGIGGQFATGISAAWSALQALGSALVSSAGFVNQHRTAFATLLGALVAVKVALVAYSVQQAISLAILKAHTVGTVQHTVVSTAAAAAAKAWAAVQWLLNAALAANPIGLVVVALAALVAAIVIAWKKSDAFKAAVIGAWNAIKSAAVSVWNAVKAAISAAWNAIKSATSAAINGVKSAVSSGFNAVKSTVTSAMNAIKAAISAAWNAIKSVVSSQVNAVKTVVSTGFNALKGVVTSAWNAIKGAVQNGIGGVVSLVASLPGKIVSALGNLGSLLYGKGQAIVQGLIAGIRSMAGAVVSAIVGLLPGPLQKFASKLGIQSPSKVFMEFGQHVGEGFALGVDGTQPRVGKAIDGLVSAPTMGTYSSRHLAAVGGPDERIGDKLDRVAAILERMPKAYQLGARQGAF